MTRAKERLYLTRAFRRGFWGNTSAVKPSRFLGDVPQRLITSLAMAGQKGAVPGLLGDARSRRERELPSQLRRRSRTAIESGTPSSERGLW